MPKARLELALPRACHRDIHRILSTSQQHIRLPADDRRTVQRRLRRVRLEHTERARVVQPRGLILARGDEVRAIGRDLKIRDDIHVRPLVVVHFFARLGVEERDLTGFVPREDVPLGVREGAHRRLRPNRVEHRHRLF